MKQHYKKKKKKISELGVPSCPSYKYLLYTYIIRRFLGKKYVGTYTSQYDIFVQIISRYVLSLIINTMYNQWYYIGIGVTDIGN